MADVGGPGSTSKCPGVALADLGDTKRMGKRTSCMHYSCPTGCTKDPRGEWVAEARRAERCRCFICRPQTASHAGVYWEQVGCLCGPRPRNGVADRHSNLLLLRRDGAATQGSVGDEWRYSAVLLYP